MPKLRAAFESEMAMADAAAVRGRRSARAFAHLEPRTSSGQQFVAPHVRSHLAMLRIGIAAARRARDRRAARARARRP